MLHLLLERAGDKRLICCFRKKLWRGFRLSRHFPESHLKVTFPTDQRDESWALVYFKLGWARILIQRNKRIHLYLDEPLFLRYGYFMPYTSMIRYADNPEERSRFFS